MGEKKFSIPRLGLEDEIDSGREKNPQKYFEVISIPEDVMGYGFIPPEMIRILQGERFKVAGFDMVEGELGLVKIEADDIAQSLGEDDPDYTPAHWWAGYAAAFKDYKGQVGGCRAQVTLEISCGEIQEGEEDPTATD